MFEEYAKETWSGSERNGYFAPSEMSTTNGYRFLNRFTGSETELPNIVHGSSSSCAIMLWFFIQLSTTLRILSTWAHRVKCHVRCLLFLQESWKWNMGTSENNPCFVPGGFTFKLYVFIHFLISCCWWKPFPNSTFYASQKDSGLEDRPIVQGRTSPVDASQKSHPCNVGELMNAQRRYQSFQIINKVYMTMNLTPIFQELRRQKKTWNSWKNLPFFQDSWNPKLYVLWNFCRIELSIKACPSKNHQKAINICKKWILETQWNIIFPYRVQCSTAISKYKWTIQEKLPMTFCLTKCSSNLLTVIMSSKCGWFHVCLLQLG